MAIECAAIVLAEYASSDRDGKLNVSGIIDTIQLPTGIPPGPFRLAMRVSVVTVLTASVADGLRHRFGVTLRHEDGKLVMNNQDVGSLEFQLNERGRRMRSNLIVELRGLQLPAAGDYELAITVNGEEVARTPLYVDEPVST